MRKRRRLADKLTIIVCAVLVAVSAFFYAPMDVSAEGITSSFNLGNEAPWGVVSLTSPVSYSVNSSVESNYVIIEGHFDSRVFSSASLWWRSVNYGVVVNNKYVPVYSSNNDGSNTAKSDFSTDFDFRIVVPSSDRYEFALRFRSAVMHSSAPSTVDIALTAEFSDIVITSISDANADDYQEGYNSGYSAGKQVGYGNGYSNGFADGEASVDTDEIYNQGFNAGKDSVDTQSYYDAGYQAGYQVAYSEGYESGYDEGYQSAMDRIDGWGADTTDYPSLVYSFSDLNSGSFVGGSFGGSSAGVDSFSDLVVSRSFESDFFINPNHTYRFDVVFDALLFSYTQDRIVTTSNSSYFLVGDFSYLLNSSYPYSSSDINSSFFVPGEFMSSTFGFEFVYYSAVVHGLSMAGVKYDSYSVNIYDMGPSGDTQNHIANQTDKLTNGFNDSKGNSVNNDFSVGLNDFETAEDSLFATATTGLKDFTFFDFQSVPAMVTGMSFVGSIMSGWFTQAGGASGVGIVLSILFSIMLVAMVLGLYRWYQSKGGKD